MRPEFLGELNSLGAICRLTDYLEAAFLLQAIGQGPTKGRMVIHQENADWLLQGMVFCFPFAWPATGRCSSTGNRNLWLRIGAVSIVLAEGAIAFQRVASFPSWRKLLNPVTTALGNSTISNPPQTSAAMRRTELTPPKGLGTDSAACGSGIQRPSTTNWYSWVPGGNSTCSTQA